MAPHQKFRAGRCCLRAIRGINSVNFTHAHARTHTHAHTRTAANMHPAIRPPTSIPGSFPAPFPHYPGVDISSLSFPSTSKIPVLPTIPGQSHACTLAHHTCLVTYSMCQNKLPISGLLNGAVRFIPFPFVICS